MIPTFSADKRLKHWHVSWHIMEREIFCVECGGLQTYSTSSQPFNSNHMAKCANDSCEPQHPWQELREILFDWKLEVIKTS